MSDPKIPGECPRCGCESVACTCGYIDELRGVIEQEDDPSNLPIDFEECPPGECDWQFVGGESDVGIEDHLECSKCGATKDYDGRFDQDFEDNVI